MGKFKRSYKGVNRERREGYAGDEPKRGIYTAKLVSAGDHTSAGGNEGTEWVFELTEEPYAGWRGWVYTNDDSTAWKETMILEAIGAIGNDEEDINTTHEKLVKSANLVRLKLRMENSEEYGSRAKVAQVLPMPEGEGKKSKSKSGGKKKSKDTETPF